MNIFDTKYLIQKLKNVLSKKYN